MLQPLSTHSPSRQPCLCRAIELLKKSPMTGSGLDWQGLRRMLLAGARRGCCAGIAMPTWREGVVNLLQIQRYLAACYMCWFGARSRNRTGTPLFRKAADFKSDVSTNFTTRAQFVALSHDAACYLNVTKGYCTTVFGQFQRFCFNCFIPFYCRNDFARYD